MMRTRSGALVLCAAALLLAACGAPTASARITPTAEPTATPPAGTFYFTAADGVTLNGQVSGRGKTALIFSNGFGVIKGTWQPLPEDLASRGYLTLLYDYRGIGASQGRNTPDLRERDLRAAVQAARARGATSIVLIGSSFGGLLSARLAAEVEAAAVVILSAPLADGSLAVGDDDLRALAMPKLFMVSQGDTQFVGDVQHMFDVAPQPKEIHVYPGAQHGSAILLTVANGADATLRLEAFLQRYAPPV